MDKRIESLESIVNNLSSEIKNIGELIGAGFKKVDTNFESVSKEIKQIHIQLDIINKKIDLLKGETTEGLEDVGMKLENLTEEISKINKVTGYDDEFKNMQAVK